MKYIYKITGKVSLIIYIFMLYQFWHLCQYGGLRKHIPMLALGIIGLVGTVVLWLISKRHNQEVNSGDNGNKKLFYTEMILLIFVIVGVICWGKMHEEEQKVAEEVWEPPVEIENSEAETEEAENAETLQI